jgi:hypothetical protein
MKKLLFSKASAYTLAVALSFFIVACLKEQSTTAPTSAKPDLVEFTRENSHLLNFINFSKDTTIL